MKKNNKPAAKRYMKTVGMVMASVMVLSSTTGQMVYAESAKDQKDTQDGEKKEEKTIVYLNGKTGNDKNSGESQDEAVKSFEKAAELAGSCGVIRICGTVTVDEEETWELPSGVSIRRAEDFEDALVRVTGCLKLDNVRLYTEDITGIPRIKSGYSPDGAGPPGVGHLRQWGVGINLCPSKGAGDAKRKAGPGADSPALIFRIRAGCSSRRRTCRSFFIKKREWVSDHGRYSG